MHRGTVPPVHLKSRNEYAIALTSQNVILKKNGERPILTSKAIFATMPPLTSLSASRIWKILMPCSLTMAYHRVNDSSSSIRKPFNRCKYWRTIVVGSCWNKPVSLEGESQPVPAVLWTICSQKRQEPHRRSSCPVSFRQSGLPFPGFIFKTDQSPVILFYSYHPDIFYAVSRKSDNIVNAVSSQSSMAHSILFTYTQRGISWKYLADFFFVSKSFSQNLAIVQINFVSLHHYTLTRNKWQLCHVPGSWHTWNERKTENGSLSQ